MNRKGRELVFFSFMCEGTSIFPFCEDHDSMPIDTCDALDAPRSTPHQSRIENTIHQREKLVLKLE